MPKGLVNESSLNSIAEAINVLNGTEGTYAPSEMGETIIDAIPTETASGNPISITDAANYPAESVVTTLEPVQEGSGDPSPDNVRPITGHTGVELTRTGKNLFDIATVEQGAIDTNGRDGTGNYNVRLRVAMNNKLRLQKGSRYTFSASQENIEIIAYAYKSNTDVTGTMIDTSWQTLPYTFVCGEDLYYRFMLRESSNSRITVSDLQSAQLEYGSTATTYEPYQGQIYSVTFPTEAGIVYGGEVDFVSGVLTVTDVYETFTTATEYGNYGVDNAPLYYVARKNGLPIKTHTSSTDPTKLLSNYFITTTGQSSAYLGNLEIRTKEAQPNRIDRYYFRWDSATLAEINEAFATTPLQVIGELNTPITYQLTPQQIELLKGENNIWTDAGTSEIEYKVDLQSYLDDATWERDWQPLNDGWNNFWIDLTDDLSVTLNFQQSIANDVSINWGDGSAVQTIAGTGTVTVTHTYAYKGHYVIKMKVGEGTLTFGNNSSLFEYVSGTSYTNICKFAEIINPNIGNRAFINNIALKKVVITNQNVEVISEAAFARCGALTEVDLKNTQVNTLAVSSFAQSGIQRIELPDTLTTIGRNAFSFCANLIEITIPDNVTAINNAAFSRAVILNVIHLLPSTPPSLGTTVFENISSTCVFYVPYSTDHSILNSYKAAENWSTYADRFMEESASLQSANVNALNAANLTDVNTSESE